MKKSRINWTLKRFNKEIANNVVSFDYPIQRAGEQWNTYQKSLLIHSVACDYPVPPLYALTEVEKVDGKDVQIYYILDGKQRLTNIRSYILGEYFLDAETPIFKIEGEEFDLAKKKFDELPEIVKDAILDFTLDIFKIEEATDEEIEEMFFRLNNGTPLSQQQKAKAKMGAESAIRLQGLAKHPLMTENAVLTKNQITKAEDEVALVQAMMLLDENYTVGKFGTKDVFDYTTSLREGKEYVFDKLEKAMNFLHESLGDSKEKTLLKKLNLPFVIYASYDAYEKGLTPHSFKFWTNSFKQKLLSKENGEMLNGVINENAWLYKLGCGQGAPKADKVEKRWTATKMELEALYKEIERELEEEKKQLEELKKQKATKPNEKADKKAETKIDAKKVTVVEPSKDEKTKEDKNENPKNEQAKQAELSLKN